MRIKRFVPNIHRLSIAILLMLVLSNIDLFAISFKLRSGIINFKHSIQLSDLVTFDKSIPEYNGIKSILSRKLQVSDNYITVFTSGKVRELIEDDLNEPVVIIGKYVVLVSPMYHAYDGAIEMLVEEIAKKQNGFSYGEYGRGFSLKVDFISSELKELKNSEVKGIHIISLNRDNARYLAYVIYERGDKKGLLGKISYQINDIYRNDAKKILKPAFTFKNNGLDNRMVQVVLRHRGISITTDGYIIEKLTGGGAYMVRVRLKPTGKVFSGYLVNAGEVLIEIP